MTTQEIKGERSPHSRRTAEQVRAGWLLGDYTAPGYLHELFFAMKKAGWAIHIPNVAAFCNEWAIGERRFYRAKAKLIAQGRLEERIKGSLEVWIVEPDKVINLAVVSDGDSSVSETDKIVSDGDSSVSETHPKVSYQESCGDSPDLSQISSKFFSDLSLSRQPTQERDLNLFNANGEPIDSYRDWLIKRARELPRPPALLEVWLEKQGRKKANQKAFEEYQSAIKRTNVPPPLPSANFQNQNQELKEYWSAILGEYSSEVAE